MTTKEVAQICGVTEKTVRENAKTFGKVFENGKSTEWSEEELKKVQLVLMKNASNAGGQCTEGSVVKSNLESSVQVGLTFQEIVNSGNVEAMKELTTFAMNACAEVARNKQLEEQNKLLLEQKEQAEANYNAEKLEHQKDKELVTHKYLTATQIKETIWKEYGKKIVVSKAVKRIPLDDNDILYKPFKNGDFTLRNLHPILHQTTQVGEHIRMQVVIAVHEGDDLTPRRIQRRIPGRPGSGVLLVKHPDAAVSCRPAVADCPASIRGTIVHQQDFQIGISLLRDGLDAVIKVFFHPVHRDNHADQR